MIVFAGTFPDFPAIAAMILTVTVLLSPIDTFSVVTNSVTLSSAICAVVKTVPLGIFTPILPIILTLPVACCAFRLAMPLHAP